MSLLIGAGENLGDQLGSPMVKGAVVSVHGRGRIPPHEHTSSYVCFVIAGSFVDMAVDPDRVIRAGDLIWYPNGEIHDNEFISDKVFCLNLHTSHAAIAPRWRRRRLQPEARRIGAEMATHLIMGSTDKLTLEGLQSELSHFLSERRSCGAPSAAIDKIMANIADEPHREWSLTELALLAGCHPTHLARSFRLATGCTIGTWRRRCRILKLCADLRKTAEPLAQLAYRHGFADQAHMTREVKLYTGRTPVAVRNLC